MMDPVTLNALCVIEISGQNDPRENMNEIRSIMLQQETLFKEQVHTLHRLYKVQKMEMQELVNRKSHFKFETAELTDGFSSVSSLEERSGELVRPVAQVYRPEPGSLSLHPFCSLKLFEGSSGSVSFGGSFQRIDHSLTKFVKNFDLERFPEDWVDESAIEPQPDNYSLASKECQNARTEDNQSVKSNGISEDGLSTNWSGKDVSGDTTGNQDSSYADPMARKVKLSHQNSFASVNGCLNSSSSEGEENNSKIAAIKMNEGILKLSTPPSGPHCCASFNHSKAFKTCSKGVEVCPNDLTDKVGLSVGCSKSNSDEGSQSMRSANSDTKTPSKKEEENMHENISVEVEEATEFHAGSVESSNLIKRKHLKEITGGRGGFDKLQKLSKRIPTRNTP